MRFFTAALILLALSIPAAAGHRHHRHHRHHIHHHAIHRQHIVRSAASGIAISGVNMVTVPTAAGPITVARPLAARFQALIADFVAAGYRPRRIGCLAHGGHVAHSRHYAGAACDFDQRGWGLTASFMYHAHALIAKHGFRDGCSFNDCGHVDDGLVVRYARRGATRGGR